MRVFAEPQTVLKTATHWPGLTLDEWADTQTTLQRWTQIVGKTRLALAPMQNHWWQVALYVTDRGLTTSPMPYNGRSFDVSFDFVGQQLVALTSDGDQRAMPLAPQSVADFYSDYMAMLRSLDIDVRIYTAPVEMADTIHFPDDREHAAYDAEAVQRWWQIVVNVDRLLKRFRGRFLGKSSPSHFWWGAFDLACTRFSGRAAPVYAGTPPNCPTWVMIEGYSHECISAGFWPGNIGAPVTEPAFYAYAYPVPAGCDLAAVRPAAAYYNRDLGEWILPYADVSSSATPDELVLEFLQSTYEAAATLAGWDRTALERPAGWTAPPSAAANG